MNFLLGRISLLVKDQIDAFERRSPDGGTLSREEWLRDVFSRDFIFKHRRRNLHYVAIDLEESDAPFIIGKIGKQGVVSENASPEGRLAEIRHERWRAALFFLDPRPHEDGQKIAIQTHKIGRPNVVLGSIAEHFNQMPIPEPYVMETGMISSSENFWSYVADNEGRITSVTFEFIAPNMFPEDTDFDREMRDMRDKERVRRAKLELQNNDGLELNTDRIRKAADYTTRSGGGLRAKAPGVAPFNSKEYNQIETVDDLDTSIVDNLKSIAKKIFKL